jgi:pyruvate, water dikinase
MSVVVWFDAFVPEQRASVGGKSASLGEMVAAGLPVPPGFAVTTEAFRRARDESGIVDHIAELLEGLDVDDLPAVSKRATAIRQLIMSWPMPADVEAEIAEAYASLCEQCEMVDVPVAVRSSATSEDSPDASFAGEHDTYLWICGAEAVSQHVRQCWASLFTDRALCYRVEMGYSHLDVAMSVAVQKMIRPKAAGVAFTLNPGNGDRSTIAIDSAWGFGEGVVSGEVTPDNFLVDKVLYAISRRTISPKTHEYRLVDGQQVKFLEVEPERVNVPSVTDAEIQAVARLARTAEKHYGCPQDIEWAVDADLPEGSSVVLLQSRPETVWSKKDRAVTHGTTDLMSSIVSTLVNPLYSRKD